MKKIFPYLIAIILTVIMFTGCKSATGPECGLFYGDSLELYVGQKIYSCDSSWICLDSIVSDTRNLTDSTGELTVALSFRIGGSEFHEQYSTADTWVEGNNYTGYIFPLIGIFIEGQSTSEYSLKVYDIYPDQAINIALYDNRYRLSCIFVRDIEG